MPLTSNLAAIEYSFRTLALLGLVYLAGLAAFEILYAFADRRGRCERVGQDGPFLALGLGPVVVLLATWLLRYAHLYRFSFLVGALVTVVAIGLLIVPRMRGPVRRPWRRWGIFATSYALGAVTFWAMVTVNEYPLRRVTSLYLLQGFQFFISGNGSQLPQYGKTIVAPVLYNGHLVSSLFALFSYGNHFAYYIFGEYWLNVLLAPAVPIGAFLLFRRFVPTLAAFSCAIVFCSLTLDVKTWSLRGETLGWLIGFTFLVAIIDIVRSTRGGHWMAGVRWTPLPALLFFGLLLTHAIATVAAIFAAAFALAHVLASRKPSRVIRVGAVCLASVTLTVALLLAFVATFSQTSALIERAPGPVAGEHDGAVQYDNAWDNAPLNSGAPAVHSKPPYVPFTTMAAIETILPIVGAFDLGFAAISLRDFPAIAVYRLHLVPPFGTALLAAMLVAAIVFFARDAGRRRRSTVRDLFWISVTILVLLAMSGLYLDSKSMALYPLAAVRRTFVYVGFFYWLAIALAAGQALRALIAGRRLPPVVVDEAIWKRVNSTAAVTVAAVFIAASIDGRLGWPPSPVSAVRLLLHRFAASAPPPEPNIATALEPMFGMATFIRQHANAGEQVYSNVVSSDNKFWFFTNGRYSMLESSSIYQLYAMIKSSAARMDDFATFALTAEPAILRRYNTRYIVLYRRPDCRLEVCYGEVVYRTSWPLFRRSASLRLVYRNDYYEIYEIRNDRGTREGRLLAHSLDGCNGKIGLAGVARAAACSTLIEQLNRLHITSVKPYLLERAHAYEESNQWGRAVADYNRALESEPSNAALLLQRAIAARHEGNVISVISDIERALELDPSLQANQPYEAIGEENTAVRRLVRRCKDVHGSSPSRIDACSSLMIVTEAQGGKELGTALKMRGMAYFDSQQWGPAINDFLQSEPYGQDAVVTADLAQAYAHTGQVDRALSAYTSAIALAPGNSDLWYLRGTLFFARGDYGAATRDFDQTLRIEADYGGAYYMRARVKEMLGRPAEAERDLQKALAVNPKLTIAASELKALRQSKAP